MMFWLVLVLLGLLAVVFVAAPIVVRDRVEDEDKNAADDREALNLQLYREHLATLQAEQPDADAAQLELEAKRNLLVDLSPREQAVGAGQSGFRLLLVVMILIPVLAVVLYSDIGAGRGSIADVRLASALQALDTNDTEAYREMTAMLATSAAKRPDDGELNFFLARSYSTLGEYEKAASTFRRLLNYYPNDATLKSYYAEALFVADDRKMTARVRTAVDAAIQMNPHDVTLMEIQGIASMTSGDTQSAVDWFKKALATGVTGQRAQLLKDAIARLEMQPDGQAAAAQSGAGSAPQEAGDGRVIRVAVQLSPAVSVPPNTAVFVFARALSGPPAPLAVQRLTVSELPATIRLDETMAMMPGMGLANFDQVEVVARVSLRGDVTPRSGDFEARSAPIDMLAVQKLVELTIEAALP